MDAIFSGSMDEIAKFCGRPDLLGGRNAFGQTTIHLAVPRPRVLKKIIKAGIPLDVLDDKGRTPLFYAAAYDSKESMLILL
ncbi:hypothetical protein N7490_000298 [Penicillium lividum]|nr:hypothetical protein N7490_000298 [Penicillium lividum]